MQKLFPLPFFAIVSLFIGTHVYGLPSEADGKKFLEAKAQEEGVITTESGLMYRIIVEGDGPKPLVNDTVAAYYIGTLIDGQEFDSCPIHKNPAVFKVDKLIPAWTEVLQLMPVGSIWEVYVPPHLGYGEKGSGRMIRRNATLVFELELVEIFEPESYDAK